MFSFSILRHPAGSTFFGQDNRHCEDGSITENIPGSTYGEFGDVKYVIVPGLNHPEDGQYHFMLQGQTSGPPTPEDTEGHSGSAGSYTGTFSLDIQETSDDVVTTSTTIANVPMTENTSATLDISSGVDTASTLVVDENGDGEDVITIAPIVGETVNYQPPAPATSATILAPVNVQTNQSSGSISIPLITPVTPVATTSEVVATTQPISTSTLAIAAHAKPLQIKKKAPLSITSPRAATSVPQTASVYNASQQPFLKKLGARVYNGLYGFWSALKKLF